MCKLHKLGKLSATFSLMSVSVYACHRDKLVIYLSNWLALPFFENILKELCIFNFYLEKKKFNRPFNFHDQRTNTKSTTFIMKFWEWYNKYCNFCEMRRFSMQEATMLWWGCWRILTRVSNGMGQIEFVNPDPIPNNKFGQKSLPISSWLGSKSWSRSLIVSNDMNFLSYTANFVTNDMSYNNQHIICLRSTCHINIMNRNDLWWILTNMSCLYNSLNWLVIYF